MIRDIGGYPNVFFDKNFILSILYIVFITHILQMGFETKNLELYQEDDKKPKKEQVKEKKDQTASAEQPIDQQKFIENKFTRLDSVFQKEKKNVQSSKGNALYADTLITNRWNIKYAIEKDAAWWRNAEVIVTDGKDTIKILLDFRSDRSIYTMTVLKNSTALKQSQANAAATKYIWML
jgi:hypothetical protein